MKIAALTIMVITVLSKVIGFGRELVLSNFYGASGITDAYLISLTIPSVIFGVIGMAINTGYIPIYSEIENKHGSIKGNDFTNNLINILIILSTIIAALGFIFTESLVKIFASGFKGETLELAIRFTRISIFGIYFTGLFSVISGFLHIKGNFAIPASVGFPLNIIMIASIFLSSKGSVDSLAYGALLASFSQLALVLPFAYFEGFKYKFTIDLKDEHIRNMIYLGLPLILGVSVGQINNLVDRTLASRIVEGGITSMNYAFRLNQFIEGIFVTSIITAMYPSMSKMAIEKNFQGLKKSIGGAIGVINLILIPATVGALVFAGQIVVLLYDRGMFDDKALQLTSSALFYYSIGMVGYGLRQVLIRAFYSVKDTKTPAMNSALGVLINIILNIILSKYMGIGGLALATSISAYIVVFFLFISLRKKIGSMGMLTIGKSFTKIVVISLIMGLLANLNFTFLVAKININLALIISITSGALLYFIMILFARIPEVDDIVNLLKKRFGRTESL